MLDVLRRSRRDRLSTHLWDDHLGLRIRFRFRRDCESRESRESRDPRDARDARDARDWRFLRIPFKRTLRPLLELAPFFLLLEVKPRARLIASNCSPFFRSLTMVRNAVFFFATGAFSCAAPAPPRAGAGFWSAMMAPRAARCDKGALSRHRRRQVTPDYHMRPMLLLDTMIPRPPWGRSPPVASPPGQIPLSGRPERPLAFPA